ncbi:adenine phosphoribosyltransferase 1 [Lepidopterella palustris CBS 459.81]|uniref:adenine phosphoribosyltransferase n=1 Tax=Lepidopterella palustris CBS 459.81 TaxID=1314670 RepID=A0A8E2JIP1_9PEZI|nr:adenine phosphoribosyltransferase 1 [Lepidopterella palustris CBS 459.81]
MSTHYSTDTSPTASAAADPTATASHPPTSKPDPTLTSNAPKGRLSAAATAGSTELTSLTISLRRALRQFPDFPSPGILFEDILPIFADPSLHESLLRALELHVTQSYPENQKPDVVVGLEARGFLFGPSLALRLGAAFVPVRKKGKLPGPCETAGYQKEYGEDFFQMQSDGVKPGQKVLVVDDIIATGGSAAAAGSLVKKLGGTLIGYVFILELDFLKGRAKLDAPVYTLLSSQEEKS